MLKKKYSYDELITKVRDIDDRDISYIIRYPEIDTYGVYGRGLMVRVGIKIYRRRNPISVPYHIIFSSAGYGNSIVSDITTYNGRIKKKHYVYMDAVNKWLSDRNIDPIKWSKNTNDKITVKEEWY